LEELYFLLDQSGAIIAFQEKDQSWAGALAFSSEQRALDFVKSSRLDAAEVAAVSVNEESAVAGLISALKKRPIRYILLDLDYASGRSRRISFDGVQLGVPVEHQFVVPGARQKAD
jgi:hypothetical protein